jgi:hypothetical protein
MEVRDGNLLTYIRENLVERSHKEKWKRSGKPKAEIAIGTVKATTQYLVKEGCMELKQGACYDTQCDNYQLFILPPNEACTAPDFDPEVQEEALTNVYRCAYGGGGGRANGRST